MSEVKAKEAVRQIGLDDIKFNKDNALMAAVSCIPLVGLIVFFIERKDLFVRYFAAQYGIMFVVLMVTGFLASIPVLNVVFICLSPLLLLGSFVLVIVGAVKAYKGERYDVPVLSKYAVQFMNRF